MHSKQLVPLYESLSSIIRCRGGVVTLITPQSTPAYYYNVVVEDTGEKYGVWLKPPQITDTGHQEAWHLGRRQDFMRSPVRPPSRRVSFGSMVRDESREEASVLNLSMAELIQLVSGSASGDRC